MNILGKAETVTRQNRNPELGVRGAVKRSMGRVKGSQAPKLRNKASREAASEP